MQERQKHFDYDIIPGRLVMSLSPSIELREIFGSESANTPDTLNYTGIADPVVDALIEKIIAAKSRDDMEVRGPRARPGAAREADLGAELVQAQLWVAYWDVFGRPDQPPPYSRGDAYWWFDQAKYDKLKAEGALR